MTDIEVRRVNGTYLSKDVVERFQAFGIVVLKEYLPPGSRDGLRALLESTLERAKLRQGTLGFSAFPNAAFLLVVARSIPV